MYTVDAVPGPPIRARTILFGGELWVSVTDLRAPAGVQGPTPVLDRMARTLTAHVRRKGGFLAHNDARRTLRSDRRYLYREVVARAEELHLIWSLPRERGIHAQDPISD